MAYGLFFPIFAWLVFTMQNFFKVFVSLVLFSPCFLLSQENRIFTGIRVASPPKIDGLPDDSVWKNLPEATAFTQLKPNPGKPSRRETRVKLAYDNAAVYVLAEMLDDYPDSILKQMSARDAFDESNTDLFAVLFDTYHDGQHASVFGVSAAGVQSDFKISGNDFDMNWNAVWQSAVKITATGWSVEMRIPYSALRFPLREKQEWGVNFSRIIRRFREFSNWNFVDPKKDGIVSQSGTLSGIEKIIAPPRLSLTPYVSAYAENYPYNIPGKNNTTYLFNGGMDLKYGLSESFTLDMTLIPDFGQVQSDNRVLNLSPFEVFYNEKRPFFTEGTELFSRADIFYSRRVGGQPLYYYKVYDQFSANEVVDQNPSQSRLYNATKMSGRTRGGLGIGIFNATSAPGYASIRDTLTGNTRKFLTQPLTNYNVAVFDQTFNKYSNFSLINTNVMRDGDAYDANVTGTQFKIANRKNSYAVNGTGAVSQLFNPGADVPVQGYKSRIGVGKISGNYQFELVERMSSDKFNPNDLGYIQKNNEFNHYFNQSYRIYTPFWIINKMSNEMGIDYLMLYTPRVTRLLNIDFNSDIDFRNYFTLGTFGAMQPFKKNYDYYEPRVPGRYFVLPDNYYFGNYFSTDYRKKFALDGKYSYRFFSGGNRNTFIYSLGPRYRFSDRLTVKFIYSNEMLSNDAGFVSMLSDTIIFGIRNINTINNELITSYIFTPRMSLSLRVRHYWSKAKYDTFFALAGDGSATATSYNQNNNIDFNAFNVDMVYTWQFLPGSEMSIVWKNSIYTQRPELVQKYFDSLNRTINSPQTNSFSIKLLYYIDYQMIKQLTGKK